ncbi:MAG: isoprenylcysteine carboxylmethyltransferase family protein [Chloroflexota bacterium]|nr:isoprenylcysteine carboxylmethyltransferase family protein [Chloroflexota bacterium]
MSWIVQAALGLVGYGAILFLSAGRLDWVWGWVFLGLLAATLISHVLILVPINPELLAERSRGICQEGAKGWDKWVATFAAGMGTVPTWVVAALDVRFEWSASLPLALHIGGLVGSVLGWALFMWAMGANAFFSEAVRIQEERGHTIVTNGPYRYVRHPGYVGAILALLATPLLLGSLWALIPAGLAAIGYVVRTALEDGMLQEELDGYTEYTQQTHYRLLPGVW